MSIYKVEIISEVNSCDTVAVAQCMVKDLHVSLVQTLTTFIKIFCALFISVQACMYQAKAQVPIV